MPEINNPAVKGMRGMLGGTLVYRQWQGRTIVSNRPVGRKKSSPRQKAHNSKFTEASKYAKDQTARPAAKAEYAKGITADKSNAYTVALSDYMNPPEVHYVKAPGYTGAIGDIITIKATDDFKVVSVTVVIFNHEGKELERGNAIANARKKFMWKYRTTVSNSKPQGTKIKVWAMDKPEHKTVVEVLI